MLSEKKHYSAVCFGILAVLNLARLLIFYLPNYVFEPTEAWAYVIRFSGIVFDMLLPAMIATEAFLRFSVDIRRAAIRVLIFSVTSVIYTLPYYYLYSVSLSISSDKSVLWGAVMAVVLTVIGALHALLLYLIIRFAARQTVAASVRARLPRVFFGAIPKERLSEWRRELSCEVVSRLDEGGIFSFDAPVPFGILCISVCQFLYRFAVELYNVFDYLITYAGAYRGGEILYMIFSLLFLIIMLFVCHAVCFLAGRLARKNKIAGCEE